MSKGKKELAAAILAAVGSIGYLLRFIFELTSYVIKIKYEDAILFGLIPCLLIAAFAVILLMGDRLKCFVAGIGACTVTLYSLIVAVSGMSAEDFEDGGSILVLGTGLVLSVVYLLGRVGIIRHKTPVCVITLLNCLLYFLLTVVSIYIYVTGSETLSSYYGFLGSVLGLTFFYIAVTVSSFSLEGKKREKKPELPENKEENPLEM